MRHAFAYDPNVLTRAEAEEQITAAGCAPLAVFAGQKVLVATGTVGNAAAVRGLALLESVPA